VSSDLIRELELLGAEVDWPATPAFRTEGRGNTVPRRKVVYLPRVPRRHVIT
jgi:hypothetical protein